MPAISTTPGSAPGATAPSKDGKDTKKSKKLWSGFGGSSSSSSSQMLISEPVVVRPPSTSPTDPRNTPSLSRTIDTNSPWFKDLILISSPPKPSSIHSAANVATSTSSSKKSSGRGFTSKSMVSLSKSSTSLDHALPPPPSHSHLHQYRDSVSLNRARSPSISILESPRHSYQPLVPNTPQSPKLLSIRHHQGSEQFTSDPIPSVGDLLTGFSVDESTLERTSMSTIASLSGSRRCKSGPIPTTTSTMITTPLLPRLPAWTRFGDKSQAHKNTKLCVDPEAPTSLYDEKTRLSYYLQDSWQQNQVDYVSGVSQHIIAPVELAQAMEQEEEEARKLKEREKQAGSEETIMDKSDAAPGSASTSPPPPPLPLRRGWTIMRSSAVETFSLDIASKKQETVDGQAPEAITLAPADEILPSVVAATATSTAPESLQDKVSTPKAGLVPEPRRLSVSIIAVSATHAQGKVPGPASPPPVIPRRSPHRSNPISPILRDV